MGAAAARAKGGLSDWAALCVSLSLGVISLLSLCSPSLPPFFSQAMPPKLDANDPAIKEVCDLFATISFTGAKAQETARKPAQAALISDAIRSHKLGEAGLDAKQGQLVVSAIVGGEALGEGRRSYLVERTKSGELDSDDRVKTAIKYLASLDPAAPIDDEAFNAACGVGVVVTPEQVKEEARKYVSENKADLDAKNGGARPNLSSMLAALKSIPALRWANTLDIKNAGEEQLNALWPKQAESAQPKKAKKAAASTPAPTASGAGAGAGGSTSKPAPTSASSSAEDPTTMFTEGFLSKLHLPGENPQLSSSLKEQHLSATRGRVFTRFPPEPNGYLHIGHTKAIAIDFGYAAHHGGLCYLRFDDTNPEAEEGKYFQSILETVRWLGFEPWTITYSSDYFQQLYELAIKLIERGGAYVDHSTAEEIQEERGGKERGGERKESKWRNRPIEENLREFEAMRAVSSAQSYLVRILKLTPHSCPPASPGQIRKGHSNSPAQTRHSGQPQSANVGSHRVSRPLHPAPPHGVHLVHLPNLRLHALPRRFDREHLPLPLHHRVCAEQGELRVALRRRGRVQAQAVRVWQAQPRGDDYE